MDDILQSRDDFGLVACREVEVASVDMSRPILGRRRKADDMRMRFIDVTIELVRENGLSRVSTRTICDAVGVKAPTLYHHFGDLAGLQKEVIEYAFVKYYTFWKNRRNVHDPYQRVRDGWDSYIAFSLAEPELFAIVSLENYARDLPTPIVEAHRDLIEDLEAIHAIRALRYEPLLAAQMFTAACIGVASMLAAQRHGIPAADNLSAIMREAILGTLIS
ncbi:TetR/AcrR family transcriptional regulator [Novosphingobium sp. PASSN1]|uniref:TetR/AcrR family transcriptional regulator n=1 Tax=Novosphingobium sp. PASSN1 TaxID=2015561 RepID=UPI000BCC86E6|nr:TetR/AcrR family transcriptional regulator [Novosphingobium sp. PASSN1]OYU34728.1 MAG: hypothetical protein CFE35_12610 [Novosphingobium sp. PASSN1]